MFCKLTPDCVAAVDKVLGGCFDLTGEEVGTGVARRLRREAAAKDREKRAAKMRHKK